MSYRGGDFRGGGIVSHCSFTPLLSILWRKFPKHGRRKVFYMGNKNKVVLVKMFFLVCVAALLDVRGVAVELILPNNDTDRFPSFSQIEV